MWNEEGSRTQLGDRVDGSAIHERRRRFGEGEGRSNEITLGAMAFALSVRPLCGVAIGSWLFPYVSVILHSPLGYDATFLYSALDTWRLMSLACLTWFPCPLAKPVEGTAGGRPSPPGHPRFEQCLHFFFESPSLLELLSSCTISLPQPLQAGVMTSHCSQNLGASASLAGSLGDVAPAHTSIRAASLNAPQLSLQGYHLFPVGC